MRSLCNFFKLICYTTYKVLCAADVLLGITLIVVGILGMTNHIPSLSATLQGGLIGGGVVNTILLLMAIGLVCKENSSYKGKFLLNPGSQTYTDKAISQYKL